MRILNLVGIDNINVLQHPEVPRELNLNSPATAIYTDFHTHTPVVIEGSTVAATVEEQMIRAHVKLNVVVDHSGEFQGVLSLNELSNDNIIRIVAQGTAREDVTVSDLMTGKLQLKALPVEELNNATVGDVLLTLQHAGMQHCLVVDQLSQSICGLISASDVARRLRLPVPVSKTPYFSEIYSAVMHSHAKTQLAGS